jgi:hypothetical protein
MGIFRRNQLADEGRKRLKKRWWVLLAIGVVTLYGQVSPETIESWSNSLQDLNDALKDLLPW